MDANLRGEVDGAAKHEGDPRNFCPSPPLPPNESFPRHSIRSVYRAYESVQSRDESLRFLLNFTAESWWTTTTTTTSRWIRFRTTVPRLFSSRFSKESDPRYTRNSLSFSLSLYFSISLSLSLYIYIYIYVYSVLSRSNRGNTLCPTV